MTTVVVGSNTFAGWETLIGLRGQPLVAIGRDPLRVTLCTPAGLPSGRIVRVIENQLGGDSSPDVHVTQTDKSVAIFWGAMPLLIATVVDDSTISLRLDLRPVGINVFDDGGILHIAGNQFARNSFRGTGTAIGLA